MILKDRKSYKFHLMVLKSRFLYVIGDMYFNIDDESQM